MEGDRDAKDDDADDGDCDDAADDDEKDDEEQLIIIWSIIMNEYNNI